MSVQNRKVVGQLLLHGPLGGEDARVKGYNLTLLDADPKGVYRDAHILDDSFWALVDDGLYAEIAASPGGVLVPIELPCVFLAEIRSKDEAQQLGDYEAICQAWELGPTFGRREYLGHALYSSFDAATRHVAGMNQVWDDPAGHRTIFGGIWRVRVDPIIMGKLRELDGGPLFLKDVADPAERLVPFDQWTARWDPE